MAFMLRPFSSKCPAYLVKRESMSLTACCLAKSIAMFHWFRWMQQSMASRTRLHWSRRWNESMNIIDENYKDSNMFSSQKLFYYCLMLTVCWYKNEKLMKVKDRKLPNRKQSKKFFSFFSSHCFVLVKFKLTQYWVIRSLINPLGFY